ncbi:uncharacterized protein LOC116169343 [Photinus pyralis]|uniref:uncharacterized protein LOC116169343 n=1 Tax=Photinus pyralis TaxID=7054 RepID=UPI0012671A06|nr:uncharacterized protein LOC116169343 [Photinus pyralis]
MAALDFAEEVINETQSIPQERNSIRQRRQEVIATNTSRQETTTELIPTTTETSTSDPTTVTVLNFFPDLANDSINEIDSDRVRLIREDEPKGAKNGTVKGRQEDDDGDGGGLLGAIISGFLGSLSNPEGGVDIDAVVNVIGSLSVARTDGTYDFSGLTDTLMAFFGGGDDGGGSDVGSFVGGLAAASIAGFANPPGAKGAGSLVGNLLKQVLPAISAPDPPAPGEKPQQSGAGGFLLNLLNGLFGTPPDANNPNPPFSFATIKSNIITAVVSAVSSILGASSSASSKG